MYKNTQKRKSIKFSNRMNKIEYYWNLLLIYYIDGENGN